MCAMLAGRLPAAEPPKLLIDLADEELLQRAPELKGVRFDHSEELMNTLPFSPISAIAA